MVTLVITNSCLNYVLFERAFANNKILRGEEKSLTNTGLEYSVKSQVALCIACHNFDA